MLTFAAALPVLALSAEDQKAYEDWYRARFGTYPVQTPDQGQGDTGSGNGSAPGGGTRPGTLQPATPTAFEQGVLDLLNQERARNGLAPVKMDPYLVQVARIKGQDMVKNGYYGHHSPTYGYSSSLLSTFGIQYRQSRENLTVAGTPAIAHESWRSSQSHRENMLKPYWTHVGIGVTPRGGSSSYHGYYVVEIFVQR